MHCSEVSIKAGFNICRSKCKWSAKTLAVVKVQWMLYTSARTDMVLLGTSYNQSKTRIFSTENSIINLYIDGTDVAQEGNFTSTVTGSVLSYTNWSSGEPDNRDGAEHCINMKGDTGAWIDRRCDRTAPSVCELECKWIASENKVLYKRTGCIEPVDKLTMRFIKLLKSHF